MSVPKPVTIHKDDDPSGNSLAMIKSADDLGVAVCWADDAPEVVRAVNAFDALLAVAKWAHPDHSDCVWTAPELHEALDRLDTAHPDWRSWV
jgi:hypothetical protein